MNTERRAAIVHFYSSSLSLSAHLRFRNPPFVQIWDALRLKLKWKWKKQYFLKFYRNNNVHWFVRTRWCTRSSRMTIACLFSNRKVKVKINKRTESKQRSILFNIELKPRDFPHSTLILTRQADAVIHCSIFGIFDCIAHQNRSKTEGGTWRHHAVINSTRVICQTTMKIMSRVIAKASQVNHGYQCWRSFFFHYVNGLFASSQQTVLREMSQYLPTLWSNDYCVRFDIKDA